MNSNFVIINVHTFAFLKQTHHNFPKSQSVASKVLYGKSDLRCFINFRGRYLLQEQLDSLFNFKKKWNLAVLLFHTYKFHNVKQPVHLTEVVVKVTLANKKLSNHEHSDSAD